MSKKKKAMLVAGALLCLNLNLFSQDISLKMKDVSVKKAMTELKSKSGYSFVYIASDLDTQKTITVQANNLKSAIDQILDGQQVSYEIKGKNIIVRRVGINNPSASNQAKRQKVEGIVKDANGDPIIGASVKEKGTTNGVVTDMDGKFVLELPGTSLLEISYIGYTTQDLIPISGKTLFVELQEDSKQLDEVVVIGYGTVKRANLGGAVATTDSKAFGSRPIQNAATALQGELPGLTIIRNGGGPGAEASMKVRDVSSINGGAPLVLIDGSEGDINSVNPADIENISVLKDGTAAIYGARASDGVVLITTKSGRKNQKTTVSFDAYYSLRTPALIKKTVNLLQHAEMALEITDGSFPVEYTRDELDLIRQNSDLVLTDAQWGRWTGYPKFYKDQDWNDMIIGNGNMQNYNINISGGGERYSYMLSLGHQREKGLPKFGDDLNKRWFVRAKSSVELFKNLTYDLNLSYEASKRDYSSGLSEGQNIWELIYKERSWVPLRNPSGQFYTFEGFDNPAQVLEEGGLSDKTTANITINNQLKWNIIDGLSLIGQAIIRKQDADENVINKSIGNYDWNNVLVRTKRTPNSAERSYRKTLYKNFTLYAEYKKNFNEKHDLNIMIGAANESQNYDSFLAQRINFDQQENMSLQLGSSKDQKAWSEGNAWTINSFFGRINYTFLNKYIIEGILRADGSSRFHPDHRWGYFPGVNAAWRLGEETFFKKLNIFDDLKVRASYGEMGNQSGIGLYDYIQLISLSSDYYPFGSGEKGQLATAGNIISTSRTWETIHTTNIGLDFAILRNRLYGSVDYFWKNNKNMLIPKTYPSMLGATAPSTNSGHLKINGWEVSLGWRDQMNDFSYSVRFNISDAKNKVVSRVGNNLITLGLNSTPTGYALNSYFGYAFDGIIQNEEELKAYIASFPNGGIPGDLTVGDAKYKDLDQDGKLSVLGDGKEGSGDVIYLGDKNPRYNFGLNLNAAYKGFDFAALIQGVGRRTMFLEGEANKPMPEAWYQSAEYWYGRTWTSERTDAKYPAITLKDKRNYNYYISTNTKHNVAYARLKNLQFGYTLPASVTAKLGISKLRFYFSGEDLFEIHNTPNGWDPEEDGGYVSYPFVRNYSLGVNLVF